MDNAMTPADLSAVMGNEGFGGGSAFFWVFALLLIFGLGGNGFNGNGGRTATVEDINNSANFSRLENQVANNGIAIAQKADAIGNGIASLGYEMATQFGGVNSAIQNCCCTTQRAVDGVNYNIATSTASINANTTAQTQRILDALAENKIQSLQSQVDTLTMQNAIASATANVVRYPTQSTYCSGSNPFCGGCGCGNI